MVYLVWFCFPSFMAQTRECASSPPFIAPGFIYRRQIKFDFWE